VIRREKGKRQKKYRTGESEARITKTYQRGLQGEGGGKTTSGRGRAGRRGAQKGNQRDTSPPGKRRSTSTNKKRKSGNVSSGTLGKKRKSSSSSGRTKRREKDHRTQEAPLKAGAEEGFQTLRKKGKGVYVFTKIEARTMKYRGKGEKGKSAEHERITPGPVKNLETPC